MRTSTFLLTALFLAQPLWAQAPSGDLLPSSSDAPVSGFTEMSAIDCSRLLKQSHDKQFLANAFAREKR